MADYTDGSSFVGIDDDAVTEDECVSTWLLQRIRSNNLYLASGRNSATCTFKASSTGALDTNTGHRPYASITSWVSVFAHRVPLVPGLKQLRLCGAYNVQSEGSTQSDVDVKIELMRNGVMLGELITTLANTDNSGTPSFEDFDKTLTLDEVYRGTQSWATLVMWVRSRDGGSSTGIDASDMLPYLQSALITSTNNDFSYTSSGPSSSSPEVHYLRMPNESTAVDIWGVDYNGSSGEMVWVNPPAASLTFDYSAAVAFDERYMSYAQFRSISIEHVYDVSSVDDPERASLYAQTAIRGRSVGKLPSGLKQINRRQRLLGFGPSGSNIDIDGNYERTSNQWPDNYAEFWRYATGDDGQTTLIDDVFMVDGENPIVTVDMLLIGTSMSAAVYQGAIKNPLSNAGRGSWEFSATVKQLDDGDTSWASATTVGSASAPVIEFPLYPTGVQQEFPFLYTKHLLHNFADVTGSTYNNVAFAFKEGMLGPNDMLLVVPVQVSIQLSSFTSRQMMPVRLTVDAGVDTIDLAPARFQTGADTVHLTCVGWSAYRRTA